MGEIIYRVVKIYEALDSLRNVEVLVTGGANGADRHAEDWAQKRKVQKVVIYGADWEKYGKAAGPMRNQRMIDDGNPDVLVIFPGGRGTAYMKRRAEIAGIEILEIVG